jgi:hypothetical protein
MKTKQEKWLHEFKEFLSSDEHREVVMQRYAKRFNVELSRARDAVNKFWMQQIQVK